MKRPSLKDRPLLFLDLETSGLDPITNEILELACVLNETTSLDTCWGLSFHRKVVFEAKIQPRRIETAHPKALEINGYTPAGWKNARPLREVLEYVAELGKDAIIVGQNIRFDMAFLNAAFKELGIEVRIDYHIVDTVTLAFEHLVPLGLKSLSLGAICKFLGVEPGTHTAMSDTYACREVYFKLRRAGRLKKLWWWARNKLR